MFRTQTIIQKLRGRALFAFEHGLRPNLPLLLIQDVGDTQQVPGRPDMDVDFFCRPGICVAEASADELDGDTFPVQICSEVVPKRMRSESRYPGVTGKFFTQAI